MRNLPNVQSRMEPAPEKELDLIAVVPTYVKLDHSSFQNIINIINKITCILMDASRQFICKFNQVKAPSLNTCPSLGQVDVYVDARYQGCHPLLLAEH